MVRPSVELNTRCPLVIFSSLSTHFFPPIDERLCQLELNVYPARTAGSFLPFCPWGHLTLDAFKILFCHFIESTPFSQAWLLIWNVPTEAPQGVSSLSHNCSWGSCYPTLLFMYLKQNLLCTIKPANVSSLCGLWGVHFIWNETSKLLFSTTFVCL